MNQLKKVAVFILSGLMLTACIPTKEIEEMAVINSRGIDIIDEARNTIQTTLITYLFDKQNPKLANTLIGEGDTIKASREDAGRYSSFELNPGQLQLELYGKETAKDGISQYTSNLTRDAGIPDTVILAISDTTANEILTDGQQTAPIDIGRFVYDLIQKETKEDSIPEAMLHVFVHHAEHAGQDATLPLIAMTEDKVELKGIALFQYDKYVGELSMEEAFLVNTFLTRMRNMPFDISVPMQPFSRDIKESDSIQEIETKTDNEKLQLNLLMINGNSKTKLTDTKNLHYQADIKMKVDLEETSIFMSIKNEQVAERIEKEIEKELKSQYEQLLTKLQEINTDPIGFGEVYRMKKEGEDLTKETWRNLFPNISVDFNVDVELMNYGSIQ